MTPKDGSTRTRARARRAKAWHPAFLEALAAGQTVQSAAADAGITRNTAYEHRKADEAFAAAWADAYDDGTDLLEEEARRRAVDGWVERGIYNDDGECIGEVRKYSDTMLALLLKGRRPEKYREQHKHEHTGVGGEPLGLRIELGPKERKALGDVLRGRPAKSND